MSRRGAVREPWAAFPANAPSRRSRAGEIV